MGAQTPSRFFKMLGCSTRSCTVQDQLSQEASVMRKYRHYNILPLFCSFVHGHHLWLVMPWISGGTLAEIVQAR